MNSEKIEMLKLLDTHEKALSKVYGGFARKFPDYQKFWAKMSSDEIAHAHMISIFLRDARAGLLGIDIDKIKIASIRNALDYLKEVMVDISKPDMQPVNAFSIALDIEQCMIEKRFFEVIERSSPELLRILSALDAATKEHIRVVETAWTDHKKRVPHDPPLSDRSIP